MMSGANRSCHLTFSILKISFLFFRNERNIVHYHDIENSWPKGLIYHYVQATSLDRRFQVLADRATQVF
jgi:hypothetical protein